MPMSAYEPASGANLPPGLFEGSPSAPWNGREPWAGRTCGECDLCGWCKLHDGREIRVCATGSGDLVEVDPGAPAQECYEGM